MRDLLIMRIAGEIATPRPLVVVFSKLRRRAVIVDDPTSGRRVYGLSVDLAHRVDGLIYDSIGKSLPEFADVQMCQDRGYIIPLAPPMRPMDDTQPYEMHLSRLVIEPIEV